METNENPSHVEINTEEAVNPTSQSYELPYILREGVSGFRTKREKEIFITSALTTVSGCFPTVKGNYSGDEVHANLYAFIVGRTGTGKSVMKYGKDLAQDIHKSIVDINAASKLTNASNVSKGKQSLPNKMLFISGNSSSSAIIKAMSDNPKGNILVETEADTLSYVLQKEFGNFSDILRKAFHHESVGQLRRMNDEYLEITEPKLSVLLSGTPGQVPGLVKSVEDGLFSRFMFLFDNSQVEWQNVFSGGKSYKEVISPLSKKLKQYYDKALQSEYKFILSEYQQKRINDLGREWLKEASQYGSNSHAIALRMSLIMYRISMVLSILRHFETEKEDLDIKCESSDLNFAQKMCRVYMNSGLALYQDLSREEKMKPIKTEVSTFLTHLPQQFEKPADVNKAAKKMKVTPRTGLNYFNALLESGHVESTGEKGKFRKIGRDGTDSKQAA